MFLQIEESVEISAVSLETRFAINEGTQRMGSSSLETDVVATSGGRFAFSYRHVPVDLTLAVEGLLTFSSSY